MSRYVTAAGLIAAIVSIFIWGMEYFPVLAMAILLLCQWEMVRAMQGADWAVSPVFALLPVPMAVVTFLFFGPYAAGAVAFVWVFLGVGIRVFKPSLPTDIAANTALVWVYPGVMALGLFFLSLNPNLTLVRTLMVLMIATSSIADSFAMFGGMLLGRHKLCPAVSPNKTVEGFVCQILSGIGTCILTGWLLRAHLNSPLPVEGAAFWWMLAGLGLLISLCTTLGDLVASSFKRGFGIKDFGKLLPGHGGALDRVDGHMPSAWAILLVALICGWL